MKLVFLLILCSVWQTIVDTSPTTIPDSLASSTEAPSKHETELLVAILTISLIVLAAILVVIVIIYKFRPNRIRKHGSYNVKFQQDEDHNERTFSGRFIPLSINHNLNWATLSNVNILESNKTYFEEKNCIVFCVDLF